MRKKAIDPELSLEDEMLLDELLAFSTEQEADDDADYEEHIRDVLKRAHQRLSELLKK